jgi:hypothetical protein
VSLNNVSLRPDKISELLMTAGIPFVLKAGTMAKFEIKLNYFKLAKSLSYFASSDSSQAEVVI